MNWNDEYDLYEDEFIQNDRQARRKRKPKVRHIPKKSDAEIRDELADDVIGLEGGFKTTYQPTLYEIEFLQDSIREFYDQALITDVLAKIKGGKEASVFRCAAHESTQTEYLAAKVYRPRKFRNLRNDKLYREGRAIMTEEGAFLKGTEDRIIRALNKKSEFGVQVQHTSWLMYEYTTLQNLHNAGASVPRPYAVSENAILMSYVGDGSLAAPTLNEVSLEPDEAQELFAKVRQNLEILLANNLIHGDLSAYNILYWDGDITFIDFPQVINPEQNMSAFAILRRDVQRVCDYFRKQGVECKPATLAEELWDRFVGLDFDDKVLELFGDMPDDEE